jgi:hypothetical protein
MTAACAADDAADDVDDAADHEELNSEEMGVYAE